jgi:hypothetical protein
MASWTVISSLLESSRNTPLRSAENPTSRQSGQKEKIANITYDDVLAASESSSTMAGITKILSSLHYAGYTTVFWRMLWEGHPMENVVFCPNWPLQRQILRAKHEVQNTPYVWDPYEIRWPIEEAHRLGLKFYAWIAVYNEGAPPEAARGYGALPWPLFYPQEFVYDTEFGLQTKFVHDHPEYQLVDRQGQKHHYGVLEWAYPQARDYWLKDLEFILDKYEVDGIYLDTRSECMSPQFADQFGFNEPIVQEYKRRYGANILECDFDLEQWRGLRGEYFTLLLIEMSHVIHARGKQLCVGTSRGDYIGFPLGNMKLDWRQWISERIIDELVMEIHGWGWGRQGYGYVTDFRTGRGLKPFDISIREDYSPPCRKNGVRLYFARDCCHESRRLIEQCCASRATMEALKPPEDWCDQMPLMPEFDGVMIGELLPPRAQ